MQYDMEEDQSPVTHNEELVGEIYFRVCEDNTWLSEQDLKALWGTGDFPQDFEVNGRERAWADLTFQDRLDYAQACTMEFASWTEQLQSPYANEAMEKSVQDPQSTKRVLDAAKRILEVLVSQRPDDEAYPESMRAVGLAVNMAAQMLHEVDGSTREQMSLEELKDYAIGCLRFGFDEHVMVTRKVMAQTPHTVH